jgi:hypothetical protein
MKEEYISTIIKLLENCDDIEMLEIILQLLQKSRNQMLDNSSLISIEAS